MGPSYAALRHQTSLGPVHMAGHNWPMSSRADSAVSTPAIARQAGPWVFAILFMIESMARASVSTVVAVQAYDLLRDGQKVSVLFTGVGIVGLFSTLMIPMVMRHVPRGRVYAAGALLILAGSAAFATFRLEGQMAGMLLRVLGAACLNITLSLYILDHIKRSELVRAEPLRLTLSTVSWTIGPYLGVWLYTSFGPWAPQAMAGFWCLVLLALFHYLRLDAGPQRASQAGSDPVRSVVRFIAQPRLRLAWMIAFSRSCFWSTFFVYSPLLLITSGLSANAGGLLVSAGNITLVTALYFGRLAQRTGVRVVIAGSLIAGAVLSILGGFAGLAAMPVLAGVMLWLATFPASALDGVGGIPFLRAVRVHERAEMSGVYRTYLDLSELLPNVIFSVALLFMPIASVFIILGLWLVLASLVAWRHLPRSM